MIFFRLFSSNSRGVNSALVLFIHGSPYSAEYEWQIMRKYFKARDIIS